MEDFIIVRKRKDYAQTITNPKISTDAATYRRVAEVATESGLTISEITRQAIHYALGHLKYADE